MTPLVAPEPRARLILPAGRRACERAADKLSERDLREPLALRHLIRRHKWFADPVQQ